MKVFISSVIRDFQPYRDAAGDGARTLGHDVKRSEDFPALTATPQQACLAGVRWADVVLVLLGRRYGQALESGLSATHEEYREARDRRPVLAFVQEGEPREPAQQAFIEEVRTWQGGRVTASFDSAHDLRNAVIRALHEFELSGQGGAVDEAEMLARGQALLPETRGIATPILSLVVVGGPRQPVLRPSELDDPALERDLMREALVGDHAALLTGEGTTTRRGEGRIVLEQPSASLQVDDLGSVRVVQPAAERQRGMTALPALIEEDVTTRLTNAIHLAGWILDRIDPVRRLTDVLPIVALNNAGYMPWRTRAEHTASPTEMSIPMVAESQVVALSPALRPRAALLHDTDRILLDFISLLRGRFRA